MKSHLSVKEIAIGKIMNVNNTLIIAVKDLSDILYAVKGPIKPEKPNPAENGVPLMSRIVATIPIIIAPMVVGINNLGFVNILAI